MAKINLLPSDVVTVHKAARITKALKVTSIFLGGASLALGFVLGGYFFYKQKTLSDLQTEYTKTKEQVLSLEASENSLVLVKDRLTKLQDIATKYPYSKALSVSNDFLSTLPTGVSIKHLAGASDSQTFTLVATDTTALESLLNSLREKQEMTEVSLKSIHFNPSTGFEVDVVVTNL